MKHVVILILLAVVLNGNAFSQDSQFMNKKFKLDELPQLKLNQPEQTPLNSNEIFIGLSLPTGRLSTQLRPGFSVGYNYNFQFTKEVDFFLNITGNLFTTKKSDSASAVENFVDIALLLEYTIGPRVAFRVAPNSPIKLMGEAGIGFYTPIGTQYIFTENSNFSGIESLSDAFRGGINIGVGAYFTGSRTIVAKIKYHKLFSIPTEYFGLYAGLTL